jgi:hypothetical protein
MGEGIYTETTTLGVVRYMLAMPGMGLLLVSPRILTGQLFFLPFLFIFGPIIGLGFAYRVRTTVDADGIRQKPWPSWFFGQEIEVPLAEIEDWTVIEDHTEYEFEEGRAPVRGGVRIQTAGPDTPAFRQPVAPPTTIRGAVSMYVSRLSAVVSDSKTNDIPHMQGGRVPLSRFWWKGPPGYIPLQNPQAFAETLEGITTGFVDPETAPSGLSGFLARRSALEVLWWGLVATLFGFSLYSQLRLVRCERQDGLEVEQLNARRSKYIDQRVTAIGVPEACPSGDTHVHLTEAIRENENFRTSSPEDADTSVVPGTAVAQFESADAAQAIPDEDPHCLRVSGVVDLQDPEQYETCLEEFEDYRVTDTQVTVLTEARRVE